jgi:glycerophosphoryl diester phosphodiesterase
MVATRPASAKRGGKLIDPERNSDMNHAFKLRYIAWVALLFALVGGAGEPFARQPAPTDSPIVIGHRGAAGYLPEHTLAGYALAVFQGADFIEPDLVMTKDGQLIARHEPILDETTDVSARPEFASRRTTKVLDGFTVTAWWAEDFTLAEIKQLKARERIPTVRPANTRVNDQIQVPTLQEVIDLAKGLEKVVGRKIGIYPETKHPTYFRKLGFAMEETLVSVLRKNGYEGKRDQVFIQSFEVANLKQLAHMTNIPLIQLFGGASSQPFDVVAAGGTLTYGQMATAQGLALISTYAYGVGPSKGYVIPVVGGILDPANATTFVRDAHAVGLAVHPYTYRVENQFLPLNLRIGTDPNARGNLQGEIEMFLDAGIDGFFTDNTDVGVKARDAFVD